MQRNKQESERLLERFLHYVGYDTQSKLGAKNSPSSQGQLRLAKHLQQELFALGLEEIELSKQGILTAFLPSNVTPKAPTIGFIAHLDTSPQCNGKHIKAEVIENYRGGDIALGIGEEFISPVYYPFLQKLIGKTLIVSDGNSLLGANNKAGIAEILTALEVLITQNIPHCNIRLAFIPDKEIYQGMNFFPWDKFSCDWAYTVAGGEVGELECENFHAANAVVTIHGRNMHTGAAKGRMINALALACEFQQGFPPDEVPEKTNDREGFFHLANFIGDLERVELHYLIRDFSDVNFEQRKAFLTMLVVDFNRHKKLRHKVELSITDQYSNMYDCIKKVPQSVFLAEKAIKASGIEPIHKVCRGGTLGAKVAEKGIACPNIFSGGYNFNSKHELITLEGMQDTTHVLVQICRLAIEMMKM